MIFLTAMEINGKLHEALKLKRLYTIGYQEGRLSCEEYLCFEKHLWGIQAREGIIKEGRDWWFLDRMSRSDIFTARF